MRKCIVFLGFVVLFSACWHAEVPKEKEKRIQDSIPKKDSVVLAIPAHKVPKPVVSDLEKMLVSMGLVSIQSVDSTLLVSLAYSTTDNFVGVDMYGDLENAYLQQDVAEKLKKAQEHLRKRDTSYKLLVYDAARPKHIQQKMWDTLKIPFQEKIKFLSNPKYHSIHNYGAAVDLTISQNGIPLDMGTPYDYIGELAHPVLENQLLAQQKLTKVQVDNRRLLRSIMRKAGFFNIQTEWWHFNSCRRSEAKQKYALIP